MLLFFMIFYVSFILTSQVKIQFRPRVDDYNEKSIPSNFTMAKALQSFQKLYEKDRQMFKMYQTQNRRDLMEVDILFDDSIQKLKAQSYYFYNYFYNLDENMILLEISLKLCKKKMLFNKALTNNRLTFSEIKKRYLFKRAAIVQAFEPGKRNQELESFENSIQGLCRELDKRNNDISQK